MSGAVSGLRMLCKESIVFRARKLQIGCQTEFRCGGEMDLHCLRLCDEHGRLGKGTQSKVQEEDRQRDNLGLVHT